MTPGRRNNTRLLGLVALAALLLVLRFGWHAMSGASSDPDPEIVGAVERPTGSVRTPGDAGVAPAASVAPGASAPEPEAPRNAFAVRGAQLAVAPPVPVVEAPPPAPPPPPPPPPPAEAPPAAPPPPLLEVIGTWDDPQEPGVFLSSVAGTVLARKGTVVLSEYRITELTEHHFSVTHEASGQSWQLPIPRVKANP